MLAAHADKKEYALNLLRNGYAAGAIARNLETSENLITHWRNEAGIPPCKPGKGRPTPAVGEVPHCPTSKLSDDHNTGDSPLGSR